jgi:hypothetical protein
MLSKLEDSTSCVVAEIILNQRMNILCSFSTRKFRVARNKMLSIQAAIFKKEIQAVKLLS